ncbi:hypothetical protein BMIN10S_01267 [Bosea minatitlanensis]
MKKTPEEIATEFTARRERAMARSGSAMWPHVLATVTVELFAKFDPVPRDILLLAVEEWGKDRDPMLKAGSEEAIARLREAIDERMRQRNDRE